ncbi:IS1/IS1595 family N-terminal zinc-binding domain-containing protein [Halorubrum trueperi]
MKKGTTGKDIQTYRCSDCDSQFNELTGTLLSAINS